MTYSPALTPKQRALVLALLPAARGTVRRMIAERPRARYLGDDALGAGLLALCHAVRRGARNPLARVNGAVLDTLRDAGLRGYRHSKVGAVPPRVLAIDGSDHGSAAPGPFELCAAADEWARALESVAPVHAATLCEWAAGAPTTNAVSSRRIRAARALRRAKGVNVKDAEPIGAGGAK